MRIYSLAAALVLGVATLSSASTAIANSDYKAMPGGACMPYGSSTWADMTWRPSGVNNPGTANQYVLCSVMHDAEYEWTDANPGYVSLVFKAQSTAPITCTLTVGSTLVGAATTYSQSLTLAAGDYGSLSFPAAVGDTSDALSYNPVSVNCRLPPKTTLVRVLVDDTQATHYTTPAP